MLGLDSSWRDDDMIGYIGISYEVAFTNIPMYVVTICHPSHWIY